MDIYDERDDLTDQDDVPAHRARAKAELDQIAQQVQQALAEAGIGISLFFLIPNSGDSILSFGTLADPSDGEWGRVGEIVSAIVRQRVRLDRTRCRPVTCATTTDDMSQPTSADGATSR
jgi:hypothetical protein